MNECLIDKNPEISIIVPVYNTEQYISRCIESILNQTFKDFELILIDDGSQDRSGEICDEYAKEDNRIRVFHNNRVLLHLLNLFLKRGIHIAFRFHPLFRRNFLVSLSLSHLLLLLRFLGVKLGCHGFLCRSCNNERVVGAVSA